MKFSDLNERRLFLCLVFCIFAFTLVHPVSGLLTADFSAVPLSGPAPLSVQFTDSSLGNPTAWAWDFGDGQTSGIQNPAHPYTAAGIYTVALNVSNAEGSSILIRPNLITVTNPPLVAAFSAYPTSGYLPLTVQFLDQSTGNPTQWFWVFGDAQYSSGQNPIHTYNEAGTYTVSLFISNAQGNSTATTPDFISVILPPPVANFTGTPRIGTVPLTVEFTDSSLNSPTAWVWEFGDLQISNAQHPTHTYNAPGPYTVNLTVFRNGLSSKISRTAYILVKPSVTGITPAWGKRGKVVAITGLNGTGFEAGAAAMLKKGTAKIKGKSVTVVSPTQITCTFNIPATAATGKWKVKVTNPDGLSGVKANAFTVKA